MEEVKVVVGRWVVVSKEEVKAEVGRRAPPPLEVDRITVEGDG